MEPHQYSIGPDSSGESPEHKQSQPVAPAAKKRGWRRQRHTGNRNFLKETLLSIAILLAAFVAALLLITYVFQSYVVDGPSMQNTLHNGDRLIVWKAPRTWATITGGQYVPARGDIIVFKEPGLAEYGGGVKQLIKRVVGLPGDRLVVSNGKVTIYNKQHPNGFDPDKALGYFGSQPIPYTAGDLDLRLGAHQIFVMGDNRPDSLDSRRFGPIQTKQIVGQLVLRVMPIKDAHGF